LDFSLNDLMHLAAGQQNRRLGFSDKHIHRGMVGASKEANFSGECNPIKRGGARAFSALLPFFLRLFPGAYSYLGCI
jgi:hypothetical protein